MHPALSTSWNAFRHRSGKAMLFEIKALGFTRVELSFNLTASMVKSILSARRKAGLRVTSVHNFCPIPPGFTRARGLPDCFSMSSSHPEKRRASIKYTKKSIDTAVQMGALAVVLHCGRVQIPDRARPLIYQCRTGGFDRRRLAKLRSSIIKDRQAAAARFFDNTLKSLEELESYARERGIALGVENRIYHREIPSLDELGIIFKKFKGSSIFYWHDTGHAQVNETLGFCRHKDYLERFAPVMAGIHLHDVRDCRDHLSPSQGKFDFSMLRPYIGKRTIKVIEAHHPATSQDIVRGREYLELKL